MCIGIPYDAGKAELQAVRRLAATMTTFADMIESDWLRTNAFFGPIGDDQLRRIISGLQRI